MILKVLPPVWGESIGLGHPTHEQWDEEILQKLLLEAGFEEGDLVKLVKVEKIDDVPFPISSNSKSTT
ncbi:MAG: hypothetical protein KGO96_07180 [Elusimicrobia bacterium]|nr:hypothetical protein [Elusimicrobiota bacterium]